jgi:hypothetical protein
LVVEGTTDETYLRCAARVGNRPELVEDIVIESVRGTTNLLARVAQLLAVAPCPVVVLVDSDDNGRKAQKAVKEHLNLRPKEQLLSYGDVMEGDFPWEAEDLFPPALIKGWVNEAGEDIVTTGRKKRPDDQWHYDISATAKGGLSAWLDDHVDPADVGLWIQTLQKVNEALQLQLARSTAAVNAS